MSVQTGRMVSADEARGDVSRQSWGPSWTEDLQHTVVVLSEQIAAARREHRPHNNGPRVSPHCETCENEWYPCPTALALGVTA